MCNLDEESPKNKSSQRLQVVKVSTLQISIRPLLPLEPTNATDLLGAVVVVDAREVVLVPDELAVLTATALVLELGPGLDDLEAADLDVSV